MPRPGTRTTTSRPSGEHPSIAGTSGEIASTFGCSSASQVFGSMSGALQEVFPAVVNPCGPVDERHVAHHQPAFLEQAPLSDTGTHFGSNVSFGTSPSHGATGTLFGICGASKDDSMNVSLQMFQVLEQMKLLTESQRRIEAELGHQAVAVDRLASGHQRIEEKLVMISMGQRSLFNRFTEGKPGAGSDGGSVQQCLPPRPVSLGKRLGGSRHESFSSFSSMRQDSFSSQRAEMPRPAGDLPPGVGNAHSGNGRSMLSTVSSSGWDNIGGVRKTNDASKQPFAGWTCGATEVHCIANARHEDNSFENTVVVGEALPVLSRVAQSRWRSGYSESTMTSVPLHHSVPVYPAEPVDYQTPSMHVDYLREMAPVILGMPVDRNEEAVAVTRSDRESMPPVPVQPCYEDEHPPSVEVAPVIATYMREPTVEDIALPCGVPEKKSSVDEEEPEQEDVEIAPEHTKFDLPAIPQEHFHERGLR